MVFRIRADANLRWLPREVGVRTQCTVRKLVPLIDAAPVRPVVLLDREREQGGRERKRPGRRDDWNVHGDVPRPGDRRDTEGDSARKSLSEHRGNKEGYARRPPPPRDATLYTFPGKHGRRGCEAGNGHTARRFGTNTEI